MRTWVHPQLLPLRNLPFPPAAKKIRRPAISRSPAILKIPQNPANPASDNIHPKSEMHPYSLLQLDFLSLIRDTKRMEVLYTELFDK